MGGGGEFMLLHLDKQLQNASLTWKQRYNNEYYSVVMIIIGCVP